ncbi:uncharacterized protein BXZ73DRAFT_76767 [Epithele typhae]|uniref:uncharacterized protein n=1 Tax=Epithele typhae TaxID=378194 RepID=UPI0020079F8F|nr:uncharacterized protein BXZ73DRAFT_76767 [Epithele typhae]KAH9935960.1 hypothetical protein BXZ73DRAFT_76767 [Epithele typhae]
MDTLKAFLLSIPAICFLLVLVPPKRANEKTSIYKGQFFEYVVRFLSSAGSAVAVAITLGHAITILALHQDFALTRPLVPYTCPAPPPSLDVLAAYTPSFVLGIVLSAAGTLVRLSAMHRLGSLFTYEVVIKPDHALVASGPYAHVRHPGYTGVALLLLGTHLVFWDPVAGYVPRCGLAGAPLLVVPPLASAFAVFSLYRRCAVEDAQLRARFGEGWERYRDRVPYCMIPHVY